MEAQCKQKADWTSEIFPLLQIRYHHSHHHDGDDHGDDDYGEGDDQ